MNYRRGDTVVEALQWQGNNRVEVARFIRGQLLAGNDPLLYPGRYLMYDTGRGYEALDIGAWLVKEQGAIIKTVSSQSFAGSYEQI